MLETFTVAFFGHRFLDDPLYVQSLIKEQALKLIQQKQFVEFLVGRNGDFDRCAASAIVELQKSYRDDNSALILVLPYPTAEFLQNENAFHRYYNDVEISEKAAWAHPKSAIRARNYEMAERADLVICYVEEEYGGAWAAIQYARRIGKNILNLAGNTDIEKSL